MASYVGKGYRRDRGADGHGQLSQIELYSPAGCCVRCANPKDGSLEEESERLNKEHHEYMLVTHDLDEQGVGVRLAERCLISGCSGHAARLRSSMVAGS